jgi:hypothetical protein
MSVRLRGEIDALEKRVQERTVELKQVNDLLVQDITERKRAEKGLRERELFNFALFEYNPIQTVAVDLEGKVTAFNLAKKRSGDRLPNIGDVMYKDYAGMHEIDMYAELMKCIRSGEEKEFREQKYGDKVLSITISPFPKGAVIISEDITERKQAEDEIKNLAKFPSENPNPILRLNQDGLILYANQASQVLLENWGCMVGSYAPSFWRDLVANLLTSKSRKIIDIECGEIIYSFVIAPITDAGYVNLYGEDITERKLAEEALEKSVQLLRDTGEMARVGGWELDLSTKEVLWTEEVGRIHGLEPGYKPKLEEALNFYAPESRPALEEVLKKATETGEPYDLESLFIPSGSKDKIWVRSLGRAVYSGGKIVKLTGTFQNIDKYKRAEEEIQALLTAVQQEKTRLSALIDSITDEVWVADTEGKFVMANPSALREFGIVTSAGGIDVEKLAASLEVYRPDGSPRPIEEAPPLRALKGEMVMNLEEIIRTPASGELRYRQVNAAPVRDATGNIVGSVSVVRDITERKQAEAERERLLAEIAAKNQELESFVYTVSHDLRAPLVSLDGFSSLLKRESQNQLGEQGQHYLERIRANVAHMNTLITELLELSRIGRVVGPEEEIDAGVLLREIEEGLVLTLEQEGVEFIVQQPLPAVRGDPGRIRQVFANLVENAVKFRSLERRLRIEVGCQEERGFYRFHVGDNGIGISPQYQEQIFEPFRQLDSGIEGVGMGLTLVKRIVEHHVGRVWVESELGKGSTFYFTIPRE